MTLRTSSPYLQPGTPLGVGDPAPPTTTHKAMAGFSYALVPVAIGALIAALNQVGALFPDAPSWVLPTVSLLVLLLTPFAAYYGVYNTSNKLLQPVVVSPAPNAPGAGGQEVVVRPPDHQ